jgi:DNA recombination protein RmuC
MAVHLTVGLVAILVGILAVGWLVWRLRADLREHGEVDTDQLSSAIGETWRSMGLERSVGQLETHADDMREFHGDITRMLQTPQMRGEFGERQLDVILQDHLPPSMYGLREQVVDGRTPDAHIESSAGHIPIDSKFPLENYERCVQAEDADERTRYRRAFATDVERQLDTIADNYVRPSEGTTDFAFAFIPSESVYYHLVREEYDLLRSYTKRGVQVVSPLTLGHKLELIKADVQAQQLSEQAEAVLEQLEALGERFDEVHDEWDTLHRHLRNAKNKADDVDAAHDRLRAAFDRIDQPRIEDADVDARSEGD